MPRSAPAIADTASVNARTVQSGLRSMAIGIGSGRSARTSTPSIQTDNASPRTPATRLRTRRLDEQAAHQRAAGCAEREAHGDVAMAIERAGQEKARQVGAREQQHEADDDGQQPGAAADVPVEGRVEQDVSERDEREARRRIPTLNRIPGERRRDAADGRVRLRQDDPVAQPGLHEQRMIAALVEHRVRRSALRPSPPGAKNAGVSPVIDPGKSAGATPTIRYERPPIRSSRPDHIAAAAESGPPVAEPEHDHGDARRDRRRLRARASGRARPSTPSSGK